MPVVSYSISTSNHNHMMIKALCARVVSYSISTSNHNYNDVRADVAQVVSYSISTSNHNRVCIILFEWMLYLIPFLHQTTTCQKKKPIINKLYLIPFLHQTTTLVINSIFVCKLYLIPFLHQTTTRPYGVGSSECCILFHFYIKPQQRRGTIV